jgi:hypothetical protein
MITWIGGRSKRRPRNDEALNTKKLRAYTQAEELKRMAEQLLEKADELTDEIKGMN